MRESLSVRIPDNIPIPEGKLLLAFSGGSDSLFLLAVLSAVAPDRSLAVYVNHSLRPDEELNKEIELNRRNAELLGIPFEIETVPRGLIGRIAAEKRIGLEAAAREVRYSILNRIARDRGYDHILTAHHREDQVETVLMRILSSSPFWSYQGVLREDELLYRPLLSVDKKTILEFLRSSGLEWSEDSTNSDILYRRNSIRHSLLPYITEEERNTIARIADNTAAFRRRFSPLKCDCSSFFTIKRSEFLSAFQFQRDEVIFSILHRFGFDDRIPRSFLDTIFEKANAVKGRYEVPEAWFFFSQEKIKVYPFIPDFAAEYKKGEDVRIGKVLLHHARPDNLTLRIDEELLCPPVVIRTSREGDWIDLKGGKRKVSELEKDMRIPLSIIMEDRKGIVAMFSRFFGGRDRLSRRFLSPEQSGTALAIEIE